MAARTRGPGAQHEQRRAEIADAVLTVVAERGLQAVSQTEVAHHAGVSAGRVQHYFPTKHDLIEAAFDRSNTQSAALIRAKVGQDLDTAPPRSVLTTVLTELIAYDGPTRAHMRVRQAFNALALADDAIAARIREQYADFHRQIAALVRREQAAGTITATADPDRTAVELVALTEGLAYYVLLDVHPADSAREQVLAAIAGLYS
jgi:AcrR family transcriptional regulator